MVRGNTKLDFCGESGFFYRTGYEEKCNEMLPSLWRFPMSPHSVAAYVDSFIQPRAQFVQFPWQLSSGERTKSMHPLAIALAGIS
jgi:hypothetical protein